MSEIDCMCTAEVVCPFCGCQNADSWELPDEDERYECAECGKVFKYERCVEVTYISAKPDDDLW